MLLKSLVDNCNCHEIYCFVNSYERACGKGEGRIISEDVAVLKKRLEAFCVVLVVMSELRR